MKPIFLQDNFLSESNCNKLIQYQKNNSPNNFDKGFWDSRIVKTYDESIEKLTDYIHSKICVLCSEFFQEEYVYLEFTNLVYWGSGMKLDPHADNYFIHEPETPHYCPYRDYSSVLYLNDDYTGGETYFPEHNFSIEPKVGRLAIFTSGSDHIHGVKKVLNGDRYTMATWFTRQKNKRLPS
jgi:Rps23 Pro-64 3,4-dihydroxylase Tpa1-like proline 4-hydroxylase|tara:strand:- start:962 stop:1504 length:543 start_codon:yes stop_codon:yes gene_type:complete